MATQTFGQERPERQVFKSDRKKTLFLDLNSSSKVRILTNTRTSVFTHYLNRATVLCPDNREECPICRSNSNLIMQYPETFRDEPMYSPRREVIMVNVLDKTLVRI